MENVSHDLTSWWGGGTLALPTTGPKQKRRTTIVSPPRAIYWSAEWLMLIQLLPLIIAKPLALRVAWLKTELEIFN